MTEARAARPAPHPLRTAIATLALFLTLLVLLAWQVRTGRDPALKGQQATAQVVAQQPRRVLVRRIVRKVVDDKIIVIHPRPQVVAAPAATAAPSGSTYVASAPAATYTPAPTYTPPAVTYTPPAPAPAPVVTRTS